MEMRVPARIITGFLGNGKTTLLNRLLTSSAGLRPGGNRERVRSGRS
jgi:predicted ATPase